MSKNEPIFVKKSTFSPQLFLIEGDKVVDSPEKFEARAELLSGSIEPETGKIPEDILNFGLRPGLTD